MAGVAGKQTAGSDGSVADLRARLLPAGSRSGDARGGHSTLVRSVRLPRSRLRLYARSRDPSHTSLHSASANWTLRHLQMMSSDRTSMTRVVRTSLTVG